MMLRHTLTAILALILVLAAAGCGDMLNAQAAKDRDLGQMVNENMSTGQFRANFVKLEYAGEPGTYNVTTKDLVDGAAAGKFGYNTMVVMVERNSTKVKTGRDRFKIIGEQDGVEIFEVTYSIGAAITVVLKGPYEGQAFNPEFK